MKWIDTDRFSLREVKLGRLRSDPDLSLRDYLERVVELVRTKEEDHCPRRGRPSKYCAELAIELCLDWSESLDLQSVLNEHGVSRATIWRWRRRNRTFRALFRLTERYRQVHRSMYPEFWRAGRDSTRQILKLRRAGAVSPRGSEASIEERRRPGGQTKYRQRFNDHVQASIPATASHLGVTQRTVYNWMRKHPEFRRRQTIRSLAARLPQIHREVENLGVRRPHRRTMSAGETTWTIQ